MVAPKSRSTDTHTNYNRNSACFFSLLFAMQSHCNRSISFVLIFNLFWCRSQPDASTLDHKFTVDCQLDVEMSEMVCLMMHGWSACSLSTKSISVELTVAQAFYLVSLSFIVADARSGSRLWQSTSRQPSSGSTFEFQRWLPSKHSELKIHKHKQMEWNVPRLQTLKKSVNSIFSK